MWQEKQAGYLKAELEDILASLKDTAGLYNLIKEPLSEAGRGLASGDAANQSWPLLSLLVCEAVSGSYEQALPVAASLQFLMAAGDIFDDIEDADSPDSVAARHNPALAVNAATLLLVLAEKALTRLKLRGVEDAVIVRIMDTVNSYYVTACIGQHLDLSLSPDLSISEDQYIKITGLKSASQIECACRVGAILAGSGLELLDKFSHFGYNLGMAAQITNDIRGVVQGKDISRRKVTLPALYALAQTEGETRRQLTGYYRGEPGSFTDSMIKELVFSTGAVHYAAVKLELYRQQASDLLLEIEQAGVNVGRLKIFLE